jgi:hypothetical protein
MSGFPWTSLITAVVPAAAVLAGAALTGRQNNQAKRLTALKKDYARFVQAATALIEHCDQIQDTAGPGPGFERIDWDVITQMVSGLALARALVDLAGSFKARQAAGAVSQVADQVAQGVSAAVYSAGSRSGSHSPNDRATYYLRLALEEFLATVRGEVGGGRWPGLKWIIRNATPRARRRNDWARRQQAHDDSGLR